MNKNCDQQSNKIRKMADESHNRQTGVKLTNFTVRGSVLKGTPTKKSLNLSIWRTFPFHVVSFMDNFMFEI